TLTASEALRPASCTTLTASEALRPASGTLTVSCATAITVKWLPAAVTPLAPRCSRRPGGFAFVVEEDFHQVEALAGRGDAGVLAVARGEGAGDGALGEAAAGDVGEGADEDAHHVVEEGVAFDVDADEARVAGILGDVDGAEGAHRARPLVGAGAEGGEVV